MDNIFLKFEDVLAHSITIVEEHGYVTKDNSYIYDQLATSERIINAIANDDDNNILETREEVTAIINWLPNSNLKCSKRMLTSFREGVKQTSEFGVIASLVNRYRYYLIDLQKRKSLDAVDFNDESLEYTRINTTARYISNYRPNTKK